MKIFTTDQIQQADQFTIAQEPITSTHLMERAAQVCSIWLLFHLKTKNQFAIFCGNGNNGGDGFAIARMLYLKGKDVKVFTYLQQPFSDDAKINLDKLKNFSGIEIFDLENTNPSDLLDKDIIIDALLGSGLNRNVEGKLTHLINTINTLPNYKVAIDLPSGIYADKNIEKDAVVLQVDETLSFQFWKKAFLHPETEKICGQVHILDIGIHPDFTRNTPSKSFVIDDQSVRKMYKPRFRFSHKGNYGKACIIGGSFGKIGAIILSVKAALRTGSGLTYALAPKCGYDIIQSTCPEAMYLYGGGNFVDNFKVEEDFCIGIGPGLSTNDEVQRYLVQFLENYLQPLVLDADALNIISLEPERLKLIPKNSILTPHPKEFARLFGNTKDSFDRLHLAIEKAKEMQIYIVLKDHRTQIITPDAEVFYNINGNVGLAKGGSGDVLTGIITSLLAQGYPPKEAAIFGVWLHGKAADLAVEETAEESLIASDVINSISKVFLKLCKI